MRQILKLSAFILLACFIAYKVLDIRQDNDKYYQQAWDNDSIKIKPRDTTKIIHIPRQKPRNKEKWVNVEN